MVPSKYIGKKVKCKECGEAYRIEDPSSGDEEDTPAVASAEVEQEVAPRKKSAKSGKASSLVRKYEDEVNPDDLMKDFRARGIVAIGLLTLILHVAVLGGTSVGYIQEEFLSEHEELPEEERKRLALGDATLAIKEISEKYNLMPDQITGMFSAGGSRADKLAEKSESKPDDKSSNRETKSETPTNGKEASEGEGEGEATDDRSDFQKKLEKVEEGPEEFTFEDEF